LPVLAAGRATFSSYMALADSAVHMLGGDYLLRHGQDYAHLDLHNSYGLFVHNYYGASYPSGADTLFGGSTFLLHLPLIWTFQPFNAFILAAASGGAWVLASHMGLRGGWAALAALSATLPALVYAYELVGSIKEVTALAMILTLGALAVVHERWLARGARAAIPFALAGAGGVSALGAGFGVWLLAAVGVVLAVLARRIVVHEQRLPTALALLAAGALVGLVCALPTWSDLTGSLHVASNIASTGNPGNLHAPLRTIQLFGVWLRGSYKQLPAGVALDFTHALVALSLTAALLGAIHLLRTRRLALAGWYALMLIAWLAVGASATTWVKAKTLMLTSPVVVLAAWGAVAALRGTSTWRAGAARGAARGAGAARAGAVAAALLALALAGGELASDLAQYHTANLAPTARYRELLSLNHRFAGRGPALVSDFDEYALYALRDLDVGGANFVYPPPALAGLADGYGYPVQLDRAAPTALQRYRLIITRRDPAASPPPVAFALAWQGTYYRVWVRTPGAVPAIAHVAVTDAPARQCARIHAQANDAARAHARLVAAAAPRLIAIDLARASHPRRWGHQRQGLVLSSPGRLSAAFAVPRAATWQLWLAGQLMPTVDVAVDGRTLGSIGGQLDGNSLVPNTMTPLSIGLSAGRHRVSVTRAGLSLAPGDGGSAVLDAMYLAPAGSPARDTVALSPGGDWRALCGHAYAWIELLRS
jgi:hypothetical protein